MLGFRVGALRFDAGFSAEGFRFNIDSGFFKGTNLTKVPMTILVEGDGFMNQRGRHDDSQPESLNSYTLNSCTQNPQLLKPKILNPGP